MTAPNLTDAYPMRVECALLMRGDSIVVGASVVTICNIGKPNPTTGKFLIYFADGGCISRGPTDRVNFAGNGIS